MNTDGKLLPSLPATSPQLTWFDLHGPGSYVPALKSFVINYSKPKISLIFCAVRDFVARGLDTKTRSRREKQSEE